MVPPLPWYRRIFRRTPRAPKVAGTRPTKVRGRGQRTARRIRGLLYLLLVLAAVATAVWFFRSELTDVGGDLLDRLGDNTPVSPAAVSASSAAEANPPDLTLDGVGNSYWRPSPESSATGSFLVYTFSEPFRLVGIAMIPGVANDPAAFLEQSSPAEVLVEVTRADGSVESRPWVVRDEPGTQEFFFGVEDVTQVRLIIADVHRPGEGRFVAVAEVQFATRA